MDHPFEVGKQYRNRHDEYVVLAIQEPLMLIRYADGTTLRTRVDIQSRIWSNIQMEAAVKREQERLEGSRQAARSGTGGRRAMSLGRRAQALRESDFQVGVAGTEWRSRSRLGGLLARELSQATTYEFLSYAVHGQAWVHIVEPAHYESKTSKQKAKFVFGLDDEQAIYGFYIERNSGPMDASWHWPSMMRALQVDEALHGELHTAMRTHSLEWRMQAHNEAAPLAVISVAGNGLQWARPGDSNQEPITWVEFVAWLGALDPETWWNLWLVASLPRADALAEGLGIAGKAVALYRALLRLYEASASLGRYQKRS